MRVEFSHAASFCEAFPLRKHGDISAKAADYFGVVDVGGGVLDYYAMARIEKLA